MIRRYWKLGAVGISCVAIGAGASVIASAGAATGSTTSAGNAAKHHGAGAALAKRGLLKHAVHGTLVVATKNGFATVTFDRGFVQSVSGQQLTLTEGTKKATYKTITLTIPTNARVRDNGKRATLADVKVGQKAVVVQGPNHVLVRARDKRAG
jgi:hypothetical protein